MLIHCDSNDLSLPANRPPYTNQTGGSGENLKRRLDRGNSQAVETMGRGTPTGLMGKLLLSFPILHFKIAFCFCFMEQTNWIIKLYAT